MNGFLRLGVFWLATAGSWAGLPGAVAQDANPTSQTLTRLQRTDTAHLEAVHKSRLQFQQERHSLPSHGLYEDFRALILCAPKDPSGALGTGAEVLELARKNGIQVVLMVEPSRPKSDSWHGLHDGVLFIPGTEMASGGLWFPDSGPDGRLLQERGLRFASPNPTNSSTDEKIIGMEICPRQFDQATIQELEKYLSTQAADNAGWERLASNYRAFPEEFFDMRTPADEMIRKWDQETQKKPLTGIGAAELTRKITVKGITFDPLAGNGRALITHILARDSSESQIREALVQGHAYVAHDWLCDPAGFAFGAVNNLGVFGMGDSAPRIGNTRLMASVPVSAKLRLLHNGSVIQETVGTNLTFQAEENGAYRVEAWLNVAGEDRPWIYSNPVYLAPPGSSGLRLPSMEISAEVEAKRNITYKEGSEEDANKHKLDVYMPRGQSNAPVFFFIHGGAWKSGDRSYYPPLGNRYGRAGFVTVVPSYRLAPKYPHPAQIEDVAAAFAWTVGHIGEYGGDTNRIYIGGHSAGGHLAALLCLDDKYLGAYQISPRIIHGVLALSGVYNLTHGETQDSVFGTDPKARRDASPLFHVRTDAPPFLVSYCQWDYFSLPAQAKEFDAALEKAHIKTRLVYIPRESHISEMLNMTKPDDPLVTAALAFMKSL